MIRAVLFLILVFAAAVPARAEDAAPKTIITDQAEADLLLGRHLFAIDTLATWYLGDYINFGDVKIKNLNKIYQIDASQICYNRSWSYPHSVRGGYIIIKGDILKIEKQAFSINGSVQLYFEPYTSMSGNKPMECTANGIIHFSRKGHPKYWRMQNTEIICGSDRNYSNVDIFTAPLKGEAPTDNCVGSKEEAEKLPNP